MKTQSEISELAWKNASEYLRSDIQREISKVLSGSEEHKVLTHILNAVVPSLERRSKIIGRNRRTY